MVKGIRYAYSVLRAYSTHSVPKLCKLFLHVLITLHHHPRGLTWYDVFEVVHLERMNLYFSRTVFMQSKRSNTIQKQNYVSHHRCDDCSNNTRELIISNNDDSKTQKNKL